MPENPTSQELLRAAFTKELEWHRNNPHLGGHLDGCFICQHEHELYEALNRPDFERIVIEQRLSGKAPRTFTRDDEQMLNNLKAEKQILSRTNDRLLRRIFLLEEEVEELKKALGKYEGS